MTPERLIGFAPETPLARAIDRLFTGARAHSRPVAEVKLSHVACTIVQAGLGIAIVDGLVLLSGAWPQLLLRPLDPAVDLQVNTAAAREALAKTSMVPQLITRSVAASVPLSGPSGLRLSRQPAQPWTGQADRIPRHHRRRAQASRGVGIRHAELNAAGLKIE